MNPFKRVAKHALESAIPQWFATVQAVRSRRLSHRLFKEWGITDLSRSLYAAHGPRVLGGPFSGMNLTPATVYEHIGPYLFGTYEFELHPALERLTRRNYTTVIDVGSKFGYYAIGLSLRYPDVPVYAFDIDPWARRATRDMAAANGARQVRTAGYCTPAALAAILGPKSLVVSDCEGYESILFPNLQCPAADKASFLIEVHESAAPGVGAALRKRFGATHSFEAIAASDTANGAFGDRLAIPDDIPAAALREIRSVQEWHVYEPLSRSGD